jgi:ribose-phosphate pyrophosphokinase
MNLSEQQIKELFTKWHTELPPKMGEIEFKKLFTQFYEEVKPRSRFGPLQLVVANSHPTLGTQVAKELGISPLDFELDRFPNQEPKIRRLGDASGCDVCIFSSLHSRYNTIEELKVICNTLEGSASRVFGVFPFVKNGKSDHQKRHGEPITYKSTAEVISESGVENIAIFDQHTPEHVMAYETRHTNLKKVHHIYLMRLLIEYALANMNFDGVIAFDDGGFKRNKTIGVSFLQCNDISFIIKARDAHTREVSIKDSVIIGDVKGKRVITFEDCIQQGGTSKAGAEIAKHNGADYVAMLVVHNDFSETTFNRLNPLLEDGTVDEIIVVETLPIIHKEKWHRNLKILSPAKFLARVIDHIHCEGHMREFFLEIS